MRFPLRVVAITGVEVGSGKGGWHVWCFAWSTFFHFITSGALCCHFRLAHIKESRERKLAGLKIFDCTILQLQRYGAGMETVYKAWHMKEGRKRRHSSRFWHLKRTALWNCSHNEDLAEQSCLAYYNFGVMVSNEIAITLDF